MQSGRIFKKGPSWYLQFRRAELRNGKEVRVQAVVKLARYSDTYRSKAAVRDLAKPYLLEQSTENPDLSLTLNQFIEDYYFRAPETKALRPSTLKNYRDIYKLRVKPSVGKVILRDFKTSTAQVIPRFAGLHVANSRLANEILPVCGFQFRYARRCLGRR